MAEDDFNDIGMEKNPANPVKVHVASNNTVDWSCIRDNETYQADADFPMRMTSSINVTFATLYAVMLVVAVIANVLTVCVTSKGKHRLLYRCCLISLACSDLMIAVSSGLSNFQKFVQYAYNFWSLGEFLCYALPFVQTMSILANSMTLSCIAVDRYLVVTQALRTFWDPSSFACVTCIVTIWVSSAGVAIPMFGHYSFITAALGQVDKPCFLFNVCSVRSKEVKNQYYIAVFAIIFLPLLCAFVVLYGLVMRFLWKHKRPGAAKPFIASGGGDVKAGATVAVAAAACPSAGARDSRKTRTVKAILALIVTFVVLRMPSWVFLLYVSEPGRELTSRGWWLAMNVCSAMVVLNSAVNPFFYCFLTQVLNAWDAMKARCCRKTGGKTGAAPQEVAVVPPEQDKSPPLQAFQTVMIPRGPYSVQDASDEQDNNHHQLRHDGAQNGGSSTVTTSMNSSPRLEGMEPGGHHHHHHNPNL